MLDMAFCSALDAGGRYAFSGYVFSVYDISATCSSTLF